MRRVTGRDLVMAIVLVTSLASGAAADRVVRFGVVDVEPLAFVAEGRPSGLFVDICTAVAEQRGWDLRFEHVTWEQGMRLLESGALDLMPTVAYSAARDSILDFGAEHVFTVWSQVYRSSGAAIENVMDLDGRRVAIMRGDMNADNFQTLIREFDVECDLVAFGSLPEVFAAVRDRQAVAGVAPNIFGHIHASAYDLAPSPILFAPFPVYFATSDGDNADLLAALDEALRTWRSDDSSYYYQRLAVWIGQAAAASGWPVWVPAALAGLAGLALLLILWNRTLERRVRRRTHQLALSEQRFRTLFESAGDAVFLMREERFVDCNPRVLELFRCRRDEIVGHRPAEFSPPVQPDGRASAEAAHERMEAATEGPTSFEWRHRRVDDTLFDAEVTLNTFEIDGERFMQASVRDITRRKQLEANLRQAQKMEAIGTLAGGIAHDFNNILSAIMGYNELARSDVPSGTELASYLDHIGSGAERARDLVLQILAFSRQTAEVKEPTDLAPIVEEAVKLLRSSIPTTIEIDHRLETPGRVLADPTSLHQIIMNLATNAYQAMASTGGRLEIRLAEAAFGGPDGEGFVDLSVADNGPGMSPDVVQKIFEPYFTTKGADSGTGLGLAVVHGIVEDHDGTIEVESMVGRGTTFRVRLPACDEPLATSDSDDVERERPAGGERVLLVDDEPAIVEVFERGLGRLGYDVSAFSRPEDALAALRAAPTEFDVLVTDMTMPGLTGDALTRAALELNPDLPILLCTGYSDGMTLDAARKVGVRDLVMKPVDISQLAHRIRMVLARIPG